eukprot:scaffold1927_cov333-Pavlova_lutheri.AAC.13
MSTWLMRAPEPTLVARLSARLARNIAMALVCTNENKGRNTAGPIKPRKVISLRTVKIGLPDCNKQSAAQPPKMAAKAIIK